LLIATKYNIVSEIKLTISINLAKTGINLGKIWTSSQALIWLHKHFIGFLHQLKKILHQSLPLPLIPDIIHNTKMYQASPQGVG
jgi:hypothetical protein